MASALCAALLAGCGGGEKPRPRAEAKPLVVRDTPSVLRGTIGAECSVVGTDPVIVSGYGLVVGLAGTGSGDAPPAVRAWMEREMTLRGVGQATYGMSNVTPREMLDDPNNCIVLVMAAISPTGPEGTRFDVAVTTLPGSAATSLEGGRLWTTDLRIGLPQPGGATTRLVGEASGDLIINAFADPAKSDERAINRTEGRILNGGVLTNPLEMIVSLDNPSHTRARAIANAINTRFTQSSGDREPTAKGRNDEAVSIVVPLRHRGNVEEFIELLKYTLIDQRFPEERAANFVRTMREEPYLATEMSWCLQALGAVAIPQLRTVYDTPDRVPRLAALRAGARLKDPLATPHLVDIAKNGAPAQRLSAIDLLGEMDPDPQINVALRGLLNDAEATIRVASYEALARRGDAALERTRVGDKFVLDVVASDVPMVYVSQQGAPRIAVFGKDLQIPRPAMVSAWSDRLLLAADSPNDAMRAMYTDYKTGRTSRANVDYRLSGLIRTLAHTSTPESPAPGFGMTYSEVVGALYELTERQKAVPASFLAEQDRLRAEIFAQARTSITTPRPELAGETVAEAEAREAYQKAKAAADAEHWVDPAGARPVVESKPTYVTPIPPKTPPEGAKSGGDGM